MEQAQNMKVVIHIKLTWHESKYSSIFELVIQKIDFIRDIIIIRYPKQLRTRTPGKVHNSSYPPDFILKLSCWNA